MAKKAKARARKPKANRATLCERMKNAAVQVAGELGYEITNLRCSVLSAMFVPGQKPERRAAFSFTVMGKDGKR